MRIFQLVALFATGILLSGCLKVPDATDSVSVSPEPSFCSTVTSYSGNTTTVTATATYQYRAVTGSGLAATGTTANIRGAEVQVLNSAGAVIQCGTTAANGSISIVIPRTAGNYTLKVLSRADSALFRGRVLNSPIDNRPYSVSTSFSLLSSDVSKAVTLPAAPYNGTLEGGAFNILDQLYNAAVYLKANTGSCTDCIAVTDIPSIPVFWSPGLSPAAYFDQPNEAVSFYLKSPNSYLQRGLYIMGGQAGAIDCADTDHFDNSVILHEYGHYLEDQFSGSESPGGSHNGNFIIDPRLAWSEGWANFVQGAILSAGNYRDTVGNPSCSGGHSLAIDLNLATSANSVLANFQDRMPQTYSGYTGNPYYFPNDIVTGEGVFREVSVSRALWDFTAQLGFNEIWEIFSGTVNGLKNSSTRFRNIGTYNEKLRAYLDTYENSELASFDALVSGEYQVANRTMYAQPLTVQSSSCTFDMTPVRNIGNGESYFGHLERSSDFYEFNYTGGSLTLTMKYQAVSGTGTAPYDLDMYIYNADHTLLDKSTMTGYSETSNLVGNVGTETVVMTGKPTGKYLIQIRAFTEGGTPYEPTRYYIRTQTGDGVRLCP